MNDPSTRRQPQSTQEVAAKSTNKTMAGPQVDTNTAAGPPSGDATDVPAPAEPKTTRNTSHPWGGLVASASQSNPTDPLLAAATDATATTNGRSSLADIMAEEEAERAVREVESEEDRMMREAIEASLQLAAQQQAAETVEDTIAIGGIDAEADDGLDEDMRMAIALSLQEAGGDALNQRNADAHAAAAAGADPAAQATDSLTETEAETIARAIQEADDGAGADPAAQATDNVIETEAEAIARAIQEADDAEAAASLKLALELQREEEEDAKRQAAARQSMKQSGGNVSTMDHDDFEYHRNADEHNDDEGEQRQLYGADDYDRYQEEYGAYEKYQAQFGSSSAQEDEGFRMNASTQSKTWSRLSRNVIVGPNNETRTKHDPQLKAQSNATRLLGAAGAKGCRKGGRDVDGPIGISDQAYNSLKQNIKKRGTVKGVERHGTGRADNYGGAKTRGGAMDGNVRLLVTRVLNQGTIDACNGVVKEGKEAIVYHANGGEGIADDEGNAVGGSGGYDVAIKVFKRIQEFKGRRNYVDGDPRYHSIKFKNIDPRRQVELWAEKEYRNLIRANRAGVPVPTPLLQEENVLFMRFLGEEGWPSPQLREVDIKKGSKKWTALYGQVMVAVRRLYHIARLVHGDLSEYNILLCPSSIIENKSIWERKENKSEEDDGSELEIVLIDLGQAVERQHPSARELLVRDLSMVRAFFVRQGIHVLSEDDALDFILKPFDEGDSADDGKEVAEGSEESDANADNCEEDSLPEEEGWRFDIPGWEDATNLEKLVEKLEATKPVSKE